MVDFLFLVWSIVIMAAELFIVATPIGNLADITFRAIDILKSVDLVAVEDTRHARKLWLKYSITTNMLLLNKDNEKNALKKVLSLLSQGSDVALISDAGTPLIHDPGFLLVSQARDMGYKVTPVPGPCALIAALCASGFDASNFIYCGFISTKKSQQIKELSSLKAESKTLVFYEAPHRLLKTISIMSSVFGSNRPAVLARELTKIYEEIVSSTLSDLVQKIESGSILAKGEIVIVIKGVDSIKQEVSQEATLTIDAFLQESLSLMSLKDAATLAGKLFKVSSNTAYKKGLIIKSDQDCV